MDNEMRERKIQFLCLASRLLLENGSETYRVEETATRMAKGIGLASLSISAFPTTILLESEGCARVLRINRRGTNTMRIAQVNAISRRISCGEIDFLEAEALLHKIEKTPPPPSWKMRIAYGISSAFFCLLLCSDIRTFIVSFVIGVLTQCVQPFFSNVEMGALFGNFAGGFLTAVLAQFAHLFIPFDSVNAAISGGIMPLLSGLLMTTAVRDTMFGDLVSGIARGAEAILLAVSVALGVYVGLEAFAIVGRLAI